MASVLTGLCLSCSFFQCKVYLHVFNLPFLIFFVPYFHIAYAQFSCCFLSGCLFALSRSSRLLNSVQSLKRWGYCIGLSYSFNSGCALTSSALHTAASSAWGHFFPQLSTAFLFTLHTLRSAGLRSFLRPPAWGTISANHFCSISAQGTISVTISAQLILISSCRFASYSFLLLPYWRFIHFVCIFIYWE